jgi:hypothetical protein
MNNLIPPYLDDREPVFIRLAEHSKAPKKGNSAKEGPFFRPGDRELQDHVKDGGNVGRVFQDDVIAIDIDHRILDEELDDWPETLVIESGGGGLGSHWYYKVPGWNENQSELSAAGKNIGSIRSGNSYCLVPPSRHDETGDKYQVSNPRNPAEISVSRLSSLVEEYGQPANTSGGGGGDRGGSAAAPAGVGGADAPIPEEYPNEEVGWNRMRTWLKSNGFLKDLRRSSGDRSGREFKLAKCLAEGGFSGQSICQALDRLPHDSKWHEEGPNYRKLTVQKAIESAVEDPYVEFTTPDEGKVKGRDLPEGQTGQVRTMSGNDSSFVEKESVVEHNGNGEVVQVRLMEGTDGDSGEKFTYVDLATGSIEKRETVDGETVEVADVSDGPGETKSLGTEENLELKVEALQKLLEEIK